MKRFEILIHLKRVKSKFQIDNYVTCLCRFSPYRIIPFSPLLYCLIHFAIVLTHSGWILRQGIIVNDLPPACKKVSFPCSAISSRVSRQSLTKAGQATNKFLTPSFGSSVSRTAVYGVSHLSLPNLDWNDSSNFDSGICRAVVTNSVVRKHWWR